MPQECPLNATSGRPRCAYTRIEHDKRKRSSWEYRCNNPAAVGYTLCTQHQRKQEAAAASIAEAS